MLKKVFIGIIVLIIAFVIVVSMQPAEFLISRSATIDAPVPVVFAQVNDFHNWEAWSPWSKLDPNSKAIYEGEPSGKGAIFRWAGNNQVGEGRQTIIESRTNQLIQIKLEFLKPFKATNTAEFTFKPLGEQTLVRWSMAGDNNFVGKAMSLFMNCDKMVGDQFEKGLAQLNEVAKAKKAK